MRRSRLTMGVSLPFRLVSVSFLLNLATEASNVFLPLYARSVGSSNLEIGLIASTYGIAFFLSSLLLGRQSDIHGRLRFIQSGLGLSAIAYLSQIVSYTPIALLVARGFVGFCLGATSAAVMAYTYENQKQIGNFVSYGSLGWLTGALLAAVLRGYGLLFLTSAISSILAFAVSLTFREEAAKRVEVAVFPLSVMNVNRKVYLAFFMRQLGANAIWAIFPLYLAGIGASRSWIAILDGINNGSQFIIMRLVERFNPAKMFRMGLFISVLIFFIYGISKNYLQVIPAQIMLAIAWSGMFIGALSYLLRKNKEYGTVSGLLYSTIYLSAGIGPFLGGAVAQVWGFVTVMYFGSSLAFLGFLSSRGLSTGDKIAVTKLHT